MWIKFYTKYPYLTYKLHKPITQWQCLVSSDHLISKSICCQHGTNTLLIPSNYSGRISPTLGILGPYPPDTHPQFTIETPYVQPFSSIRHLFPSLWINSWLKPTLLHSRKTYSTLTSFSYTTCIWLRTLCTSLCQHYPNQSPYCPLTYVSIGLEGLHPQDRTHSNNGMSSVKFCKDWVETNAEWMKTKARELEHLASLRQVGYIHYNQPAPCMRGNHHRLSKSVKEFGEELRPKFLNWRISRCRKNVSMWEERFHGPPERRGLHHVAHCMSKLLKWNSTVCPPWWFRALDNQVVVDTLRTRTNRHRADWTSS